MTCTLNRFNTTRFGEVSYTDTEAITFEAGGLLGFNETKFILVDPQDNTPIVWLQSLEHAGIAFPLLNAAILFPELTSKLWLTPLESAYLIMTIPSNVTEMTVNTRAPIIMNNTDMTATQRISEDKTNTQVNHPVYAALRNHIVTVGA